LIEYVVGLVWSVTEQSPQHFSLSFLWSWSTLVLIIWRTQKRQITGATGLHSDWFVHSNWDCLCDHLWLSIHLLTLSAPVSLLVNLPWSIFWFAPDFTRF